MKSTPLGPVMLDVAGLELTQNDRKLLTHPAIGGVILFARNYESRAQISHLCKTIRAPRNPSIDRRQANRSQNSIEIC